MWFASGVHLYNIAVTCICWFESNAAATQTPACVKPPQTGKGLLFKRASDGPKLPRSLRIDDAVMLSSETGFGPLTRKSVDVHVLHPLLSVTLMLNITYQNNFATSIYTNTTKTIKGPEDHVGTCYRQWRIQDLTLGGAWTLSTRGGGENVENQ